VMRSKTWSSTSRCRGLPRKSKGCDVLKSPTCCFGVGNEVTRWSCGFYDGIVEQNILLQSYG
jgi:hypothetical protein